jgi:uracil-DNA glycosylase family 4
MHGPHCHDCPLAGKQDAFGLKGREDARFLVVTDAPSFRPEAYGRYLPQAAMTVFGKSMAHEGFDKNDFVLHPQVRCPHDPDYYTTKEKRLIAKCCRPYLLEAIDKVNPEVVVTLGAEAAKQVFGHPLKITKVRGIPARTEELGETVILPMLSPVMVSLYPQHEPTFRADCATLGRLVDNSYDMIGASQSVLGQYEFIDDLQFLVDAHPERIGFDTENTGLQWFAPDAKTLTMQFSIEPGKAYMLPWDHPDSPQSSRAKVRLKRQLRQLLCNPDTLVIGQNAKYDAVYTYAQTGIRYPIGGDTLTLAALLDENSYTKNLDDLVKRFVPEMAGYADRFNATVDKSRLIEHPLDQDFLDYGCGDADSTLRLDTALYKELATDERLLAHYQRVSLPGLNAFASVELQGLYVDEAQVEVFEAFMEERVGEMKASLLRQVPRSIKRAHVEAGLKFSRPDFVRDILFHHPDGFKLKPRVWTKSTAKLEGNRKVPSTSTKDHLPYFYDTCPFVYELSEYIKSARVLGANVKGFKKKYIFRTDDGHQIVRPTYTLWKAVTGRSTSEDPNGQNFPARGPIAMAYRKLFIARRNYFILAADLSQIELRIAADMANDPTMIRIFSQAGDIHTATALIVLGMSEAAFNSLPKEEQKLARFKAKAVNFGFLYGMGWRKFVAYAKTQYGVAFTEKEAQRIRGAFFAKYFKLPEWHAKMREHAAKHGMVRSYSGRVRHLPMIGSHDEVVRSEAERQAINSPVQEFGSSSGVMSCGRINEEIDQRYLALVGFVHDAIYAYVPAQYLEWGAKTLKWYMESNPLEEWFNRRLKVPIVAEIGFGVNLGDIFEMGDLETDGGYISVGDYNFDKLLGDVENPPEIPEQLIPPNNGRLEDGLYTSAT